MKKLLLVLLVATATTAMAAKDSLIDPNYNSAPWRMALKPEFQFSSINGKFAGLAGVQLDTSLARSLYLGAGGYGLVNNVRPDNPNEKLGAFDFWYAGFVVDYTFLHEELIHGSLNAIIGGGKVSPAVGDPANVFVATPGVSLQIRLTPDIELGIGAGYRFVSGSDVPSDNAMSKPFASIFLRLNESY